MSCSDGGHVFTTFGQTISHKFPDPLRIEITKPITLKLEDGELALGQQTTLAQQIADAVLAAISPALTQIEGDITMAKMSIQELIDQTVKDEATADQINAGITAIEGQLADVNAKLLAADDEADIASLKAEQAKLSAKLADGLAAVTPATTTVPPVLTPTA